MMCVPICLHLVLAVSWFLICSLVGHSILSPLTEPVCISRGRCVDNKRGIWLFLIQLQHLHNKVVTRAIAE